MRRSGEEHTLVMLTDEELVSCGDNGFKELGQGDVASQNRFGFVYAGQQNDPNQFAHICGEKILLK